MNEPPKHQQFDTGEVVKTQRFAVSLSFPSSNLSLCLRKDVLVVNLSTDVNSTSKRKANLCLWVSSTVAKLRCVSRKTKIAGNPRQGLKVVGDNFLFWESSHSESSSVNTCISGTSVRFSVPFLFVPTPNQRKGTVAVLSRKRKLREISRECQWCFLGQISSIFAKG